ncbi:MAG TPA: HDOD domain-containing protein [Kofleriaceae bacterium]
MTIAEVAAAGETVRVRQFDGLPTLPIVALQLGEVVHSKSASVQAVAEVLRSDPATSAKLLRLVNSPYFGIPGGVSDVARAIPFIGFNTLYQLVLSVTVLETLKLGAGHLDPRALWTHALTVATASRELAVELRFADPGACFTAGLLHDMGKIALAKLDPETLAAVYATMRADGMSLKDAERKHNLAPHDRLGSRLARQWRFPATLATPIEQHHSVHKLEVRERLAPQLRTMTEIVAVADHLSLACQAPFMTSTFEEDGEPEFDELFARNGLAVSQRDQLRDRTRTQLEQSKVFLSLLSA